MGAVKVRKQGMDWLMECEQHREQVWCQFHIDAYEVALGHVCMHHPQTGKSAQGVESN